MTRFGRYELHERLGRGGMGEVWRASYEDRGVRRLVVVKRILAELVADPEIVRMFAREAELGARLDHPHLVPLIEFGDIDGEYFMAMQYVDGVNLARVYAEQRRLGAPSVGLGAYVARDAARALAHAHALRDPDGAPLGLVHRDVSPANLMLSFTGETKLLDFGIAKRLGAVTDSRTRTGVFKGKVEYMAPEQAEGDDADQRSDQFALGVVLFELVTGQRLFRGENDLQTVARIRRAEIPLPSSINPAVPPSLDAICLRALARAPAERFADCDALADELDAVVAELGWDRDRAAALVETLFPGRDTAPTRVELRLAAPVAHTKRRASRSRSRAPWLAMGAAILLASIAWWRRGREVAPPVAAPAPPAPSISVEVKSDPGGAAVWVGDDTTSRGTTPLSLSLLRGTTWTTVRVELPGYATERLRFVPERDVQLHVALRPLPAEPAPRAPTVEAAHVHKPVKRPPPRRPASPPEGASRPDVAAGAVVDPFGR